MWRGGLGGAYRLPTLSSVGASLAPPCSVSTPRSSNRTCGFAASGSRRRLTQSPRPLPVTPSATSENNSGVIRLIANLPFYRRFLRPPSTEAPSLPRLRQYYEPLRHPSQPGPSLTSCQLIHTAITAGTSRVAHGPSCLHAVATTPAGPMETCSLMRFHRLRPSPNRRRVGPCITLFEACSAFTHVTACMLAESPMRPSTPKASAASLPPLLLRLLPGGTNQLPDGISLPLRTSAFSRRTTICALIRLEIGKRQLPPIAKCA